MGGRTKANEKPRKKLVVKKQTVKDLSIQGPRGVRGGALPKEGNASFCGMNTPTYSDKHTCKCLTPQTDY